MSKKQCWEQTEAAAIEAARRESGFARGGYGVYVAAGMPGYDPDKPFIPAGGGKKIRRADTDGIARNGRRCIVCGAPLRGNQRKFCGPICRYGQRGKGAPIEGRKRTCEICGRDLGHLREGAKYCSPECAHKAHYLRRRMREEGKL